MGNFEFDFDHWAKLAKDDPAGFEAQRMQILEALIADAPERLRHRLRGMQWQLDQVRSRSSNPMASCLRMSRMMWEKVLGEDGLLDSMRGLGEKAAPRAQRERADVVTLRDRDRK